MDTTAAACGDIVQMEHVSKVFGEFTALDDVSVALRLGQIHALVGENGAGKTTLMKALFGMHAPTSGRILVEGVDVTPHWTTRKAIARGIGMVHQHFSLVNEHSVLDNIVMPTLHWSDLAPDWRKFHDRLAQLQEQLGFSLAPRKPVGQLSIGERQQVEILKMLYQGARILILDEPTAVLIPQQVQRLLDTLGQLRDLGYAVIIITHKLEHACFFADHITVLRGGRLVRSMPAADTHPAEVASLMVRQDVVAVHRPRVDSAGDTILEMDRVSVAADGVVALDGVDLQVRAGEVVGIAGVMGNGQSELVDVIVGLTDKSDGDLLFHGRSLDAVDTARRRAAGVAVIPEDRHAHAIVGDMDLAAHFILGRESCSPFSRRGILNTRTITDFAQRCCAEFDVRAHSTAMPIRFLSGGNQQKAVIGREFSRQPSLIVAHEPSRGLDIAATAYVRSRLVQAAEAGAGVLLISSDLDELMELSSRILVLYNGRIVGELDASVYDVEQLGRLMAGVGGRDGQTAAANGQVAAAARSTESIHA